MALIRRIIKNVYSKVTTKQSIIFTIIFILFTALVLPYVSVQTTRIIGVADSPDTNFNFSLSDLFSIIESYGKEGRRFYIIVRWSFDVVWPIVYTLFLASTIAYLARRTKCKYKHKLLYFVLLAVLFDFLENINATILMAVFPIEISLIGYLLIISSLLKWTFIGLSFIILVLILIRFIINYFRQTLAP